MATDVLLALMTSVLLVHLYAAPLYFFCLMLLLLFSVIKQQHLRFAYRDSLPLTKHVILLILPPATHMRILTFTSVVIYLIQFRTCLCVGFNGGNQTQCQLYPPLYTQAQANLIVGVENCVFSHKCDSGMLFFYYYEVCFY